MRVPFEKNHELFSTTATSSAALSPSPDSDQSSNAIVDTLILPVIHQDQAIHQDQDHDLRLIDPTKEEDLKRYFRDDLNVDRLNMVHKHLWLAGLPRCARPLHHQLMIDRKIMITERADLHLLWRDNRLYLKPLPDYLFSYDIWEGTLLRDRDLPENARGFLLSYLWLIRQKSDYVIAQREHLVSGDLTWEHWTRFSTAIFPNIVLKDLEGICPRYIYGELRLGRVNLIYRLCRNTRSFKTLVRGYFYSYHTYASFIEQNFAWVLTVIVYITINLTAMQVGLATTELQASKSFNRASYGFTVFSIMAPWGILLALLLVILILILFNLDHAFRRRSSTLENLPNVFGSAVLEPYQH